MLLQPVPDDLHQVGPIRCAEEIAIRLHHATGIDPADSVKRFSEGRGIPLYVPPGDRFPWRTPNQTYDADGNAVVIDTLACEGDPWYNGDDKDKDVKSQGSSPPPVETKLSDSPGEGFTNIAPGITEI